MELLSTHVGADFDALASVLVARRLHPQAEIFFPGSREASVRRLLASGFVEFAELRQRQIDPSAIERVILCDVRQRDRIGRLGEWLAERPEIEIWAYDHHAEGDLEIVGGRVDSAVGSTSTILSEVFAEHGLIPTVTEATLLLLGIYEDTGALTFATTHPRDLDAASGLLRQGGDLALVRRFASAALDPERLDLLHQIARALEVHRIHGHRVGLAEIDLPSYVEEVAPLVSKSLDLFGLPMLFVLFGFEERVLVVGRGDAPGVDLGQLLGGLGGGGHATAASARLHGALVEVREQLLAELQQRLPPAARARDLMVEASVALDPAATIEQAKERLRIGGVNAAPVLDGEGRAIGAVTRQLLDAALQHGLGARPIETAMTQDLAWVAADAPADEVGRRMLALQPRFVLVGDSTDGRPLGLVTRMQLLHYLGARLDLETEAGGLSEGAGALRVAGAREGNPERHRAARREAAELLARADPATREHIERIAAVARTEKIPVYLVGGFVRDLLLRRENRDLDLVVEGDGPAFARSLGKALDAPVRVHEAFLTAVIRTPGGEIDVATARSEFYRAPAALPEVASSALRQDLYRRDFTVNTLAIRLGPLSESGAPELIDPFGGRRDLEQGVLRVLHSLSFLDDPTRALRAVRLERRLGLHLASETERLIGIALKEGAFDRLSGARLRAELDLLLGEEAVALPGLERLAALGVLGAIEPKLVHDRALIPEAETRLRGALAAWDWYRLEGLTEPAVDLAELLGLALAIDLPLDARRRLADRLALNGGPRARRLGVAEAVKDALAALAENARPSEVSAALSGLGGEELLLVFAATDETGRSWIRRDLAELRTIEPSIRGADLIAAGIPEGPALGSALRAVKSALQDGELAAGRETEMAFALGTVPVAAVGEEAL
ncbi:MAG TPA: CBS domain-containing protein [Thermoanaerobaculia bacterium]|nr:CBS domain-containing protein [Thermoanaerobaculia bacterium]